MKRFTNHEEAWGKFVDIKINAEELIPDNLEKYKGKRFNSCRAGITITTLNDVVRRKVEHYTASVEKRIASYFEENGINGEVYLKGTL